MSRMFVLPLAAAVMASMLASVPAVAGEKSDVKSAASQSKPSSTPAAQGTFISATTGKKKQAASPPVTNGTTDSTQIVSPHAPAAIRFKNGRKDN